MLYRILTYFYNTTNHTNYPVGLLWELHTLSSWSVLYLLWSRQSCLIYKSFQSVSIYHLWVISFLPPQTLFSMQQWPYKGNFFPSTFLVVYWISKVPTSGLFKLSMTHISKPHFFLSFYLHASFWGGLHYQPNLLK